MPELIPEEVVQAVAEKLYRDYDSEFGADHLSWRDFEGQARELLGVAAPLIAEHIARAIEAARPAKPPETDLQRPATLESRLAYNESARIAREAFPKGDDHA